MQETSFPVERPTISADELGALLMPSVRDPGRWLKNHHQDLTARSGLPKKLPGGWVWSRAAVMSWMVNYGAPRPVRVEANTNVIASQQKKILAGFQGARV